MIIDEEKKISAYVIPGVKIRYTAIGIISNIENIVGFQITTKTRKREIVEARQIAMYVIKNRTRLSLAKIGEFCGNKDHATVLHACKTVNNLLETDKQYFKKYRGLLEYYNLI